MEAQINHQMRKTTIQVCKKTDSLIYHVHNWHDRKHCLVPTPTAVCSSTTFRCQVAPQNSCVPVKCSCVFFIWFLKRVWQHIGFIFSFNITSLWLQHACWRFTACQLVLSYFTKLGTMFTKHQISIQNWLAIMLMWAELTTIAFWCLIHILDSWLPITNDCSTNSGQMRHPPFNTVNCWVLSCGEQWSRGRAPDCQSRGQWSNPTYRRFET